ARSCARRSGPSGPETEATVCGSFRRCRCRHGRETVAENDMEAFEYAVKKDVRNNPIVREVDEARQRDMWKSVGVAGFLVIVLLFSAWQHFELLRHGYQIEELQRERAAEEEAARQL